jgi:hypothetical protein
MLERIAEALGPLRHRMVFLGGCATGLLITDPAAAPIRATRDVDVIVETPDRSAYFALEKEMKKRGFRHDQSAGVSSRTRISPSVRTGISPLPV